MTVVQQIILYCLALPIMGTFVLALIGEHIEECKANKKKMRENKKKTRETNERYQEIAFKWNLRKEVHS